MSHQGLSLNFAFRTSEQEIFGLLELTPELLERLSASDEGSIFLKSCASDQFIETSSPETTGNAVLCTKDRTFELRQRQTSNTLFITESSTESLGETDPSVTIIGQCKVIMELRDLDPAPEWFLEKMLPVFATDDASRQDVEKSSKTAIFDDVPASEAEFEAAWRELCAFEYNGTAWRPDAQTLKKTWETLFTVATANGIHIDEPFCLDPVERDIEEDGVLLPVCYAVLASITNGEFKGKSSNNCPGLSADRCVRWVGDILLQSIASDEPCSSSHLLREWKALLPDQWHGEVEMAKLQHLYTRSSPTTIQYSKMPTRLPGEYHAATNKHDQRGPTKKWHEMFRKGRSQRP